MNFISVFLAALLSCWLWRKLQPLILLKAQLQSNYGYYRFQYFAGGQCWAKFAIAPCTCSIRKYCIGGCFNFANRIFVCIHTYLGYLSALPWPILVKLAPARRLSSSQFVSAMEPAEPSAAAAVASGHLQKCRHYARLLFFYGGLFRGPISA